MSKVNSNNRLVLPTSVTEDVLIRARPSDGDTWHWAANIRALLEHGYCEVCGRTPIGCKREGCEAFHEHNKNLYRINE